MSQGIQVMGVYVQDQDKALGLLRRQARLSRPHRRAQARLSLAHGAAPGAAAFPTGLFAPGPPVHDAQTAQTLRAMVAKGAMPPLVLHVDDCRATCERLRAAGVEFTQEPVDRHDNVDAGFRDPSGTGGS